MEVKSIESVTLDQEIKKVWNALSSVLDASPTDKTLLIVINKVFHHLIRAGEYDEKTILNAIREYYKAQRLARLSQAFERLYF